MTGRNAERSEQGQPIMRVADFNVGDLFDVGDDFVRLGMIPLV